MRQGTLCMFKNPITNDEKTAIMSVIEDRDSRVLVTDVRFSDWTIKPTNVYLKSDLRAVCPQCVGVKQ